MRSLPTTAELDAPLFDPPMIYRYMYPKSYLPSTPARRSNLPASGSTLAAEPLQVADSPMSDAFATACVDEHDSAAPMSEIESLEDSDGESSSGSVPGCNAASSTDEISMSMDVSEDSILLDTPAPKFQVQLPLFENLVRCMPSSTRKPWHRVHALRASYLQRLKDYQDSSKDGSTSAQAERNANPKADAGQRKYVRMTERQRLLLEMVFDEITPHPCMAWREVLVCVLDVTPDRLDNWFQRRRHQTKHAEEAHTESKGRHAKTKAKRGPSASASAPPECALTTTPDSERMPLRTSALKLKLSPQVRNHHVYAEIEERGGWWSTEMFTDLVLYAWSILHLDPWASSGRGGEC